MLSAVTPENGRAKSRLERLKKCYSQGGARIFGFGEALAKEQV
jgi:hypothetical protein